MRDTNAIGKRGEEIAHDFLIKKGLSFREKNWRCGHLEVDLIFEDNSSVRIIEVKTLLERDGFDPTENVSTLKMKRVIRAAQHYINIHRINKEVYFDVVTVIIKEDGEAVVEYIPEAFLPIK